jgi:hypothetical protein
MKENYVEMTLRAQTDREIKTELSDVIDVFTHG